MTILLVDTLTLTEIRSKSLPSLGGLELLLNAQDFIFQLLLPLHCLFGRQLQLLHILANLSSILCNQSWRLQSMTDQLKFFFDPLELRFCKLCSFNCSFQLLFLYPELPVDQHFMWCGWLLGEKTPVTCSAHPASARCLKPFLSSASGSCPTPPRSPRCSGTCFPQLSPAIIVTKFYIHLGRGRGHASLITVGLICGGGRT